MKRDNCVTSYKNNGKVTRQARIFLVVITIIIVIIIITIIIMMMMMMIIIIIIIIIISEFRDHAQNARPCIEARLRFSGGLQYFENMADSIECFHCRAMKNKV